jgi:hypothetical protein
MADSRVKELYRRLGPVLYARANRVLKDPKAAERLTKVVTDELAGLGELSDAALLKRGRLRLAELCKEQGSGILDSMPMLSQIKRG